MALIVAPSAAVTSVMIRTTLAATPHGVTVLAARAVTLTGVVTAAGTVAVLGLGVATVVRDAATSIGTILGLLFLFPILSPAIGDPHCQRLLQQLGPMSAGLAIQTTTDLPGPPVSPWEGLGVLAAWAAVALLTAGLLLHHRDV